MMEKPEAAPPAVSPGIEPLLQIAGDLRDLPRDAFRKRLAAALLATSAAQLPPVIEDGASEAEILAAIDLVVPVAEMRPFDLGTASRGLPERSMRFLTPLNTSLIGVTHSWAHTSWERHDTDELLYLLEGDTDIVTLTEQGPRRSTARQGSLFVCPGGLWHQLQPHTPLTMFFATPAATQAAGADDPRVAAMLARPVVAEQQPQLAAADVAGTIRDLPSLVITEETTGDEADAAVRSLGWMDESMIGVMRFEGLTPWECHPDGDELLYVLEGGVDLTALTEDGGERRVKLSAGTAFVCPQGLWHRQLAEPSTAILYVTPVKTSKISFADDPRVEG
jgi:quercetin dioxygenase-like cupin family protein